MTIKKPKFDTVDYIFWFLLLLFSNPGGIFAAFGEDTSTTGSIDMRDFIFVLLVGCFVMILHKSKAEGEAFKKASKYIILFGLYYLIVFGFMIPTFKETPGYTPFTFYKKARKTVYSLTLFFIIYRFYLRSYLLFFKTYVLSSILIMGLFFISFFTGIEILPIEKMSRGFIKIDRIFLASYGFLPLLIPLGVSLIVFKVNLKWKKLVITAFVMMFLTWLLSLTRRHILGTFVYFFIAIMLYNYFERKSLIPVKKMLSMAFLFVIFGFLIALSFPKYAEAGIAGVEEAAYVIEHGETSSGREDVRMGMGKDFMQNLIADNFWFGTGFDERWRGKGDKQGYETSDYPFLSAIAMTGIFGILIFLPIYIILVRAVIYDIKFLWKNRVNYQSFEFFMLIFFIVYFIYDLIQYMNWFLPVSLSRSFKWYAYLAMYLGAREVYYKQFHFSKNQASLNNG